MEVDEVGGGGVSTGIVEAGAHLADVGGDAYKVNGDVVVGYNAGKV